MKRVVQPVASFEGSSGFPRRRREFGQWRALAGVGLAVIAVFAVADGMLGWYQKSVLREKQILRERLDRLGFYGLRMGIDDISFRAGEGYSIRLRVQNATREAFYVLMPVIEGFAQKGFSWEPFAVVPTGGDSEGTVVKLVDERETLRLAKIEGQSYAEPLAGYRHVKLTAEAFLSIEENPREEIGERKEEFFLFVRDAARDGEFTAGGRPSYIPLRAWTLIPKEALK